MKMASRFPNQIISVIKFDHFHPYFRVILISVKLSLGFDEMLGVFTWMQQAVVALGGQANEESLFLISCV